MCHGRILFIRQIDSRIASIQAAGATLPSVTSITLLGMTLSADMRLELHFREIYCRCCRGMAAVRKLKAFGAPQDILWQCYLALVFSHVAYAWPAYCDLSQCNLKQLLQLESQAMRLCGRPGSYQFLMRLDSNCRKLFRRVSGNCSHPLRVLFITRPPTRYNLRKSLPLVCPGKSARLLKTFLKYYNS